MPRLKKELSYTFPPPLGVHGLCQDELHLYPFPSTSLIITHYFNQLLWVLAYSTVVEYSQQEGFYRVPLPAARQTPNLDDQ
jgi:hypothetical protein